MIKWDYEYKVGFLMSGTPSNDPGPRPLGVIGRLKARARALKTETYALYLAGRDRRTPWHARLLAAAVVAYALSPIDLIPDFIPVLGYLDDLILIPLGLTLAIRMVPEEVMRECRERAREELDGRAPRGWYAAAVIAAVWLALLLWIALTVYRRLG